MISHWMMAAGLPLATGGYGVSVAFGGVYTDNVFDKIGLTMFVSGVALLVFGASAWLVGF